jgi:hypothetical protein
MGPFPSDSYSQPLTALVYATRHGLADARGQASYFWTMFTRPDERRQLLIEV